jgi:anti-sigma factor RsiW
MNSRSFRCSTNRLQSFLKDDLDEFERAGLDNHLETCPACQKALERLAAGSGLWRSLGMLAEHRSGSPTPDRSA